MLKKRHCWYGSDQVNYCNNSNINYHGQGFSNYQDHNHGVSKHRECGTNSNYRVNSQEKAFT